MRMLTKVKSLKEVVETIKDGDHLTLSGFAHSLAPLAFVRELIRQGRRDLEITAMGEAWAVDLLSGAGALRRVRMSNFMFEGYGRCQNFSRAVETGGVETEDYSHFGVTSRFIAGALGIPYIPTRVMNGTDIERIRNFESDKVKVAECPFTGETLTLVPAVQPDVAIIHASRADKEGNIQLFGMNSVIDEQARSAKRIIVTVEEIVPDLVIRRQPELTILPGFMVDAVVEVPFGAHPAGMYRYYDYDAEHIQYYWDLSRYPEGTKKYLDQYVLGVEDHMAYLEKIGIARLMGLRADPALGYSLKMRGDSFGM